MVAFGAVILDKAHGKVQSCARYLFQAYQHCKLCAPTEHVWIPQSVQRPQQGCAVSGAGPITGGARSGLAARFRWHQDLGVQTQHGNLQEGRYRRSQVDQKTILKEHHPAEWQEEFQPKHQREFCSGRREGKRRLEDPQAIFPAIPDSTAAAAPTAISPATAAMAEVSICRKYRNGRACLHVSASTDASTVPSANAKSVTLTFAFASTHTHAHTQGPHQQTHVNTTNGQAFSTYPSTDSFFNQSYHPQSLETKYSELSQSYNELRYDYSNLQLKHEEIIEHLKGLNFDMTKLLDFLTSFISLHNTPSEAYNDSMKRYSKSDEGDTSKQIQNQQQELNILEQDLMKFRTGLMNRFQKSLDLVRQQQQLQPQQQPQPQPQQPQPQPHPHPQQLQQPGIGVLNQHPTTRDGRSVSRNSLPPNSALPSSLAPPVFAVPAPPGPALNAAQHNTSYFQPADNFSGPRMIMMNPFENTGQPSSVKRNMSMLMDPLSSAPNMNVMIPPHLTSSPVRQPYYSSPNIGGQIVRNPSPLMNSTKASKLEASSNETANQPSSLNSNLSAGKRTSRLTVKEGTFVMKPSKTNMGTAATTAKRNSFQSDNSSRSNSVVSLANENSNANASASEWNGTKDSTMVGLPFKTFYPQVSRNENSNETSTQSASIRSHPLGLNHGAEPNVASSATANVSTQGEHTSTASIPRSYKPTDTGTNSPDPSKRDIPASAPHTIEQASIVSPIPTRSINADLDNSRGSSGVYSLLNKEGSTASASEDETNPKKKVKL